MPKEKIYDQSDLFDVEIGWSSGRQVQLGISTHSGVSLIDWLAGQGEHVDPDHPDAVEGSALPSFSSLWASLDRAGVNRLIRVLRTARDSAYGKDE